MPEATETFQTHIFKPESHLGRSVYCADSKALDVFFKNGRAGYRFLDAPPEKVEGLNAADQPGSYLQQHIMKSCRSVKLECLACGKPIDSPDVVIKDYPDGMRKALHSKCVA